MNRIESIPFRLNALNQMDEPVRKKEAQAEKLGRQVSDLSALSNSEKALARFYSIAIVVAAVVMIALGIGTSFVNPFCAFLILGGAAILGTLILPKRKYEKGKVLETEARGLNPQIETLRNEVQLIRQFKAALSSSYLQSYAKKYGIDSLSYDQYLQIPQQIREFAKTYPQHRPQPSYEIPTAFQKDPELCQRICPLTLLPIGDPVKDLASGFLYEKSAALEWIRSQSRLAHAPRIQVEDCPGIRRQIVARLDTLFKENPSPYLQTYAERSGKKAISYEEYLQLPKQIREFAAAHPNYIPRPYSDEIPLAFQNDPRLSRSICPLTLLPIADPVLDPKKNIYYERLAVLDWLENHPGLPQTPDSTHLVECPLLRRGIVEQLESLHRENPRVPKTLKISRFRPPPENGKVWSDKALREAICVMTTDIPLDPVEDLTNEGRSLFEKEEIYRWLRENSSHPINHTPMSRRDVRERPDLADRIGAFFPVNLSEVPEVPALQREPSDEKEANPQAPQQPPRGKLSRFLNALYPTKILSFFRRS